jgi:CTP-dependent riboflavin kinase
LERWEQIQRTAEAIEIVPPDPSFCRALCFQVEVSAPSSGEKVQGAVLWPQVTGYPADKIEVVAPVNIKQAFGVHDGDRLTLSFF